MADFQFIEYVATPTEKHMGIAWVKFLGRITLGFKIIPGKDGKGYFVGCASYKMPSPGGGDKYDEAFLLESRSDSKMCDDLIMRHVHHAIDQSNKRSNPSVFDASQGNPVSFNDTPAYSTTSFVAEPVQAELPF